LPNSGRSRRLHRHEVFDGHAFKSNRREECVQMPAKMAQISPLGRRSGCQDYGRRPRRQAVLSKRGNSAKIHPGLGFIWGIPVQAIPPATPLVKDGKLRALAITAKTRSPALPDVPTLDELGIKGQEAETMQGVLVPAGTPKPIVDLLQTEIARIVNLPDVRDKMLAMGLEPDGMSPAEFAAYIKADVAKWKKVIADAKIPQIGG
jgi:hypothetical protein